MKYPIAAAIVLGLTSALSTAQAQSPHTPPTPAQMAEHRVAHYTTLLSLSSAQVEGATAFFTEEATSETALHGRERTAHEALKAAVKSNEAAAIQEAATTLGQLEGERTALHATAEAKFYATLTSDQKTKFTELEREHGMRGPGGPPPPPQ